MQVWWFWFPAIVWSAILLSASGNTASASHTAGLVRWIAQLIVPSLSDPAFEAIHVIVRKSVHVIAYGIAGALNFRAVRGERAGWTLRWAAIAVALVGLVASIDEIHQSFLPSRTGLASDVVVDLCGAILAQIVWRRVALRP